LKKAYTFMSKAIVICTTPKTTDWLNNLLTSFKGYDKFPIVILSDYSYELGKINYIHKTTCITDFFLLQDSIEIKDPSIFEKGFAYSGSIAWDSSFKSYLGKYRREILDKCNIPTPKTKMDSVVFEETFNWEYISKEPKGWFLHDDFSKRDVFEDKFGRTNMVIEDEYLKKYKHIWNRDMVPQEL
jgi:hypothetical protein